MNGLPLVLGTVGVLAAAGELHARNASYPDYTVRAGSANPLPVVGVGLLLAGGATAAAAWMHLGKKRAPAPTPTTPPPVAVPEPSQAPAAPAPSLPSHPDDAFYHALLAGLGAPVSANALTFLYAWRQAEGGSARYNPFNTTLPMPGAVDQVTSAGNHHVKHYPDPATGLAATVKTLSNTRYAAITSALRAGDPPLVAARALRDSKWGTGGLAEKVLAGYAAGARVAARPIAAVPGAPVTGLVA